MANDRISDFVEGTSAASLKQKENGEAPRLQTAQPLVSGWLREVSASVKLTPLNDSEQAMVDAAIQSLLSSWARQAVSEGRNFNVQQ